jgi:capsular exopolysaccharide synthesis family protein
MLNRIRPPKKTSSSTSIVNFSESPVFESYRAIRTSLIFSNAVDSIRSVGVTSSSPGDGKSTTTSNLATAFAQQGLRVLVIDCDLRRGSLHKLLNVPRSPGLTHAIAAGGDLSDVVKPTAVENLFVVTAGIHPPNPSELLGSARMRDLLGQAHREYDLVLIDTPPVLAAADASIIASMVDGMIMVIRIGATTRSAARTAQERLTLVGSRIIGTVLNDPSEHLDSSEQYYYYDYSSAGSA